MQLAEKGIRPSQEWYIYRTIFGLYELILETFYVDYRDYSTCTFN